MSANNSERLPQFELPETQEGLEKQREQAMEAQPMSEPTATKQPQLANPQMITATPTLTAAPAQDDKQLKTNDLATAFEAKDGDRIEKQWIDRAKMIAAQTQDDPYKQKHALSKVKADYIKKRFNKTIPTDDTVTA